MATLNLALKPECKSDLPVRVIQFGEGNFLRGFIDWMVFKCNQKGLFNGRILALQPTPNGRSVPKLKAQDCLYTTILHGVVDGNNTEISEIVNVIADAKNPYNDLEWEQTKEAACDPNVKFIFSNTTEAGIAYVKEEVLGAKAPLSFPAKLTALLYKRFKNFTGADADRGLIIMPCELIDDNGSKLKEIVLKHIADHNLGADFKAYVEQDCRFLNTLVDRVVSGYPHDLEAHYQKTLGYEDALMATGEIFGFMAIEGGKDLEEILPFAKAGLNVVIDEDISKYRLRKVRILNGGHTSNVPAAFLAGLDTVDEMMSHEVTGRFARKVIYEEIIPAVNLDKDMLTSFADDVVNRFCDVSMHHQLSSILMNCASKLKARVLPSLCDARAKGQTPKCLCCSVAAFMALYTHTQGVPVTVVREEGKSGEFRDDEGAVSFLVSALKGLDGTEAAAKGVIKTILANKELWGCDLSTDDYVVSEVAKSLAAIQKDGILAALKACL